MSVELVRKCYRTGRLLDAANAARELNPALRDQARGLIVGVQALMELGRFAQAAEMGLAAAAQASETEAAALRVQSLYATMMSNPTAHARSLVREELRALAARADAWAQAITIRWETRLLGLEVVLCVHPMTRMSEVATGLETAARCFRVAGCEEEARGELFQAAEFAEKGPPRNPKRAQRILEQIKNEAVGANDLVSTARAALRLAELGIEDAMGGPEAPSQDRVQEALAAYGQVLEAYNQADISAGEAEVRASWGRKQMRFGDATGVMQLRLAAELWEKAGHDGAADGAWRDLHVWHYYRADREEVEALEEKLCAAPLINSSLTAVTSEVQLAQAAFARGDFVEAVEIARSAQQRTDVPGQLAPLLLMESSALNGRGARAAAAQAASKAVAALRPADPCSLLSDALFQLGTVQSDPSETIRYWEAAAQVDLACGLNLSAALRYANIAELITQPGLNFAAADGKHADDFFKKASDVVGPGRDLESIVARGNIAQRRGLVAFRAGDFPSCGKYFTDAENYFRGAGRNADLAFTLGHQGLVLFQVARGKRALAMFTSALERFEEAARLFQRQDLLGEQFRMERLQGAASWEAGSLATEPERASLYESAGRHMSAAANAMETLRKGRQERELFERQSSLDDFAALMEPFLEEAFRFHLSVLGRPGDALGWLEKRKARGLLDKLADGQFVPAHPEPDGALAKEEQRLESERRSLTQSGYLARKHWKELTTELEQLWSKMAEQPSHAAYAAVRLGLPTDWPRWRHSLDIQSRLPEAAGRRILSVHLIWPRNENDPIRLIACRNDWEQPETAAVSTSRRSVGAFLQQAFGVPGRSGLSTWLKMAGGDAAWCNRFAPLIAPIAEWAAPGDIVVLIPHGPLHSAPLNALLIDGQPLAERNALCFAPSAAIVQARWERRLSRARAGTSAVIGCPAPGGGFPPLRRAEKEAMEVAGLLGTTPRLGNTIAPADFQKAVGNRWAVHFAGHATEAESGWDSGLQLGDGLSFTARDFFQTRLEAEIFTLSGCRTARSRRREGDEMLGLIPALLYAGASSVLASQWEASDEPTSLLMTQFYSSLQSAPRLSKADALRQAIGRTRQKSPELLHWAAFTLHGDWK